ncbi:hypothetical protein HYH02_014888 [Chlamydomonas schloesseri]|uniref:Uncharacterized protein n=1 Tax=Chlamydomonas schloesseri TaxID=2026947 RepID=A0A835VR15_9CHLO|nr:hypothetical protein HYH02_014888 [Chlamydomonas schloesseri]|eukprot:KAG2426027.1 hypothetical protein HYH02_014888 [Chlamydomonas schloesseri]
MASSSNAGFNTINNNTTTNNNNPYHAANNAGAGPQNHTPVYRPSSSRSVISSQVKLLSNALCVSQTNLAAARDRAVSLESRYKEADGQRAALSASLTDKTNELTLMKSKNTKLEQQERVLLERIDNLLRYNRDQETFWAGKNRRLAVEATVMTRCGVAVGSFAYLLAQMTGENLSVDLANPQSIDNLIRIAALYAFRLSPNTTVGATMRQLYRSTAVVTEPRAYLAARMPLYASPMSETVRKESAGFTRMVVDCLQTGINVTGHLALTCTSVVPLAPPAPADNSAAPPPPQSAAPAKTETAVEQDKA